MSDASDDRDDRDEAQPATAPAGRATADPAAPDLNDPTRTSAREPEAPRPSPDIDAGATPQLRDRARYRIINEHGRGGLGRVSRAHDRELGRDVAIKELLARGHISEVRFMREALITARLEHPGIVPVHEAGRWPDGTPFYAMKLVSGRPLRDLIAERTTVDARIALLHHVIAVADALAYAHDRGIIHRDLKPANVIVGNFGETIVIDWGLAKDLTAGDDPFAPTASSSLSPGSSPGPGSSHPFRARGIDDLTAAGAVLGTPSYMAPEQERGEPVDQRADVFAIGAMLWELCSLNKVPPTDPAHRHRVLRAAGIDRDLATIVDKSLAPNPADRYPHAGALAADLKAFKSGARIAARTYSLPALLAHWVRRHRALAISAGLIIIVTAVGGALYVTNVTAERSNALASERAAQLAKSATAATLSALSLEHAELQLTIDPTAALDTLNAYQGSDHDTVSRLRSEALGLGTAKLRARPHTNNIYWTQGLPDGSVVTLGADGNIIRSTESNNTVLASDANHTLVHSYAHARHILAYPCHPDNLCLLDLLHGIKLPLPPSLHLSPIAEVEFSPNETSIAIVTKSGSTELYSISDSFSFTQTATFSTPAGFGILFVNDQTVAIATPFGFELIDLHNQSTTSVRSELWGSIPSFWLSEPETDTIAFTTKSGGIKLFDLTTHQFSKAHQLCSDAISGLTLLRHRSLIAYACQEGTVGLWDPHTHALSPIEHLKGETEQLTTSEDNSYLLVASTGNAITIIDLATHLSHSYRGHTSRLSSIFAPTAEFPLAISADVSGNIRTWPLADRYARVIANLHGNIPSTIFEEASQLFVSATGAQKLSFSALEASRARSDVDAPHNPHAYQLRANSESSVWAAFGPQTDLELWSLEHEPLLRHFKVDPNDSIQDLLFLHGTTDFISIDYTGKLTHWTLSGKSTPLHDFGQPLLALTISSTTNLMLAAAADNSLYMYDGRTTSSVAHLDSVVRLIAAAPDGASFWIGTAGGSVFSLDATTREISAETRIPDEVRQIFFAKNGDIAIIAADNGVLHIGRRSPAHADHRSWHWTKVSARSHWADATSDGLIIAGGNDGNLRFFDIEHNTNLVVPVSTGQFTNIVVARSGRLACATDNQGHVIALDIEAIRNRISN